MKKIYFLFTMLLGLSLSFAQTPIITAVVDGDCSGGNPKMVELYAHGTVDFSMYSMEKQSNGGDWGTTTNLADLGTVTDAFVYVYSDSNDPEVFATEFADATTAIENSVVNINGDDGIRIVMDADMSVVDQFGADGVDGSGTAWEYADGYAKRNNGAGPNAAFIESEWTFGNGLLNGEGLCQGGTAFQDVMGGIGVYTPTGGSTEPSLAITNPANNAVLPMGTTEVTLEFAVSNFTIGATDSGADGHVHYQVDGGNTVMYYSTDPIQITGLAAGEHTIFMWLVDNSHQPLDPEVTATSVFTIPGEMSVNNIAELRAGAQDGSIYTLTSEAILTMQQSYRNQKYIQDATAAILIDDNAGIITSTYNRYDGITGISGTLTEFRGVLQFIPTADPGAATSTGNMVEPQVVTIAEFNANQEMYESELVKFENVWYTGEGTIWETGTNYNFMQNDVPEDVLLARTNFYDADYIGTALPTDMVHLVGIAAEFNGAPQMFPRDSEDIINAMAVNDINVNAANVKVAVSNNTLYVSGFEAEKVAVYDINGKVVRNSTQLGGLQAGTYIAVMKNAEGQMVSVKFIKK